MNGNACFISFFKSHTKSYYYLKIFKLLLKYWYKCVCICWHSKYEFMFVCGFIKWMYYSTLCVEIIFMVSMFSEYYIMVYWYDEQWKRKNFIMLKWTCEALPWYLSAFFIIITYLLFNQYYIIFIFLMIFWAYIFIEKKKQSDWVSITDWNVDVKWYLLNFIIDSYSCFHHKLIQSN